MTMLIKKWKINLFEMVKFSTEELKKVKKDGTLPCITFRFSISNKRAENGHVLKIKSLNSLGNDWY